MSEDSGKVAVITGAVGKGATVLTILPRLLPDSLLDRIRMRILGLSAFIAERPPHESENGTPAAKKTPVPIPN